jgi:hypothetical protein
MALCGGMFCILFFCVRARQDAVNHAHDFFTAPILPRFLFSLQPLVYLIQRPNFLFSTAPNLPNIQWISTMAMPSSTSTMVSHHFFL